MAMLGKFRAGAQIVVAPARSQRGIDDVEDTPGPGAHDGDALPEIDGFIDAVRNKQDGLRGLFPDPQ